MIEVNIERTNPPDAVVEYFCTRCARAITAATIANDLPLLEKEKRNDVSGDSDQNQLDGNGDQPGSTDRERLADSSESPQPAGAPGELGNREAVSELAQEQEPGQRRPARKTRDRDVAGE
jgi:hypothetical protein